MVEDSKPFKAKIRWGSDSSDDQEPSVYSYATQAELDAFLEGVDAANGWLDYELIEEEEKSDDPL